MMFELVEGKRVSDKAKLVVAVFPEDGLAGNAVWVDASAAEADNLTTWEIIIVNIEVAPEEEITRNLLLAEAKLLNLDERGIIRVGAIVNPGDILVGKTTLNKEVSTPEEKLLRAIFGERGLQKDASFHSPYKDQGLILEVKSSPRGARLTIGFRRPLRVGDVIEDTAKNQYVVGGIAPIVVPKANDAYGCFHKVGLLVLPETALAKTLIEQIAVKVGNRKRTITAGRVEFRKVTRCQEEKWVARSISGLYSLTTLMPMGTGPNPGQKITRTEIALLLGSDAPWPIVLKEFFTIKSDAVEARNRAYEAVVKNEPVEVSGVPQVRERIAYFLKGLCLKPVLVTNGGEEIDFGLDDRVNKPIIGFRIKPASQENVLAWSSGQVKKPETINYHILKPEPGGIFCEQIFGPVKDWECACGEFRGIKHQGVICDHCGVEVTQSSTRQKRMGHIVLSQPVVHPWFIPLLAEKLGLEPRLVQEIALFDKDVVTEETAVFKQGEILGKDNYLQLPHYLSGAAAIQWLCRQKGIDAEDFFLDAIPIIPPGLRQMVRRRQDLAFYVSDLNDLYRRVINRSNRLKRLIELKVPRVIIDDEMRMLQESIWTLFDNPNSPKPVVAANNRVLASLFQELGVALGQLLEKRVDFSGRGVVVPDPGLKMRHIGLPKSFLLELFRPFLMAELLKEELAITVKTARQMVEEAGPQVLDVLGQLIKDKLVLVFYQKGLVLAVLRPVMTEYSEALVLHPKTAAALGIAFRGEQVVVHLPLSDKAQQEAKDFLYPSRKEGLGEDVIPLMKESETLTSFTDGVTVEKIMIWTQGDIQILKDLDKMALGIL